MNRLITKSLAVVALVGALMAFSTAKSEAAFFTGSIDYTGSYVPNNNDLTVATQATILAARVCDFCTSGSFTVIPDLTLLDHESPIVFRPVPGVPYMPLWSDAASGFSFNLLTMSIGPGNTTTSLTLIGTGVFHDANGILDDTEAAWNMTLNKIGQTASFSASTAVPEPVSLSLLGLGLAGVAARRRATR